MYFCYASPKRKEYAKCHCFFDGLETFSFMKLNALCIFSKVCQLHEQKVSEASDLSEVYRKQDDQKNGFHESDVKSAKSTVFGRMETKEYDFLFFQLYRFQKMPKLRLNRCPKEYALMPTYSLCLRPLQSPVAKRRVCNTGCTSVQQSIYYLGSQPSISWKSKNR